MGLDSVELVLAYEDAFGMQIPDEAAAQMQTPRDVINYVLPRLSSAGYAPCLHVSAFYLIRHGFSTQLRVPSRNVRLKTPLDELVPEDERPTTWHTLALTLGINPRARLSRRPWPELSRPGWVDAAIFLAAAVVLVAAILFLPQVGIRGANAFWMGMGGCFLAIYGGAVVTRPLQKHFPRKLYTVEHLVAHIAHKVPHAGKRGRHGWTAEQVEWVVRRAIIDVLGITKFSLDDHFVRDLSVD